MYYKNGLIYFINSCTINHTNYYMNLCEDIRRLIWKYAHMYPFIQCYICDKILMRFNYNTLQLELETDLNDNTIENYSIVNGITKCNQCLVD